MAYSEEFWKKVQKAYESGKYSHKEVAAKFKIGNSTLSKRIKVGEWVRTYRDPEITPGKRGPKPYKPDWTQIDKMAMIFCTGEEIAAILNVDYETLNRACKRDHQKKISEYITDKSANGKISLRRKQYLIATEGNVQMLIHMDKSVLGYTEKTELDHRSGDGTMTPTKIRRQIVKSK